MSYKGHTAIRAERAERLRSGVSKDLADEIARIEYGLDSAGWDLRIAIRHDRPAVELRRSIIAGERELARLTAEVAR